ncbi:MAG: alkaline phosphatase family protein [Acidimicrobiales bacterium]
MLAVLAATMAMLGLSAAPTLAHERAQRHIGHVFVIVLENQGYKDTFANPKADPYLASTLPAKGAMLPNYYGTAHESNANYTAMVSGQGPNLQSQLDCQVYTDFVGVPALIGGQALGTGCVYPQAVQTVGNQLTENGLSWKGYMEDMGNVASRESATCGHPVLNSQDKTEAAVGGDGYVPRHDPWVYFHSVIDDSSYCAHHVVPLGTTAGGLPRSAPAGTSGLAADLRSVATTPSLSLVVPNVCNDGHDFPCVNQRSGGSALADTDAFLAKWVPLITGSPAFKQDGLLVVTFDESGGPQADSSACCGEGPSLDSPLPGLTGFGGGQVGAVLVSPSIKPGTKSAVAYNHYSLLASIEKMFGLPRLGYASAAATFGKDVFG